MAAALFAAFVPFFAAADETKLLNIFTRDEAGQRHFFLQNNSPAPVTTTIEMSLDNMSGSIQFPKTYVLAANQTMDAFALAPLKQDLPWHYNFTNFATVGRSDATPDRGYIYALPFAPGTSFTVSQGFHGKFSHSGPDEFAVDFKMPEGTPVHAARGGCVIEVQDQHQEGGADRKFEKCANIILIQHADGTTGIYGHLQVKGSRVKVGDVILAGDLIGLSGNTGFTSGAHLHFAVFKPRDGRDCESLPIKFLTANRGIITPVYGASYEAAVWDRNVVDLAANVLLASFH